MDLADAPETTLADELIGRADRTRLALVSTSARLSVADLRDRVQQAAGDLDLEARSVVVLSGPPSIDYVVTYLALLHARHVPLLTARDPDHLAAAWPGAAVIDVGASITVEHPCGTRPQLHPDLALLLSTSGSTGSPKLVRLSHRNVLSNARSIVAYLGLGESDRGITSLPLHYCYGLSVLHSHLLAGAGIVLTDTSVVDPCFASAMNDHGVTNLAGVPHTFELLERSDPERIHVPTLRYLTQAGGKMHPIDVARWTDRAHGWGSDFYVMYGQTEATARMAYLPPDIAARRPNAIGVPIPGGTLELRAVAGEPDDVGELVYRGPNVMMGYATVPADLAHGPVTDELPTGDLARFHEDDGVFEIVGRRSRFVKPFGLRIDLDHVERELSHRWAIAIAGDDAALAVVAPNADSVEVRAAVIALTGLPSTAVIVVDEPIPRTASGKVDYLAIARRFDDGAGRITDPEPPATRTEVSVDALSRLYAVMLGRGEPIDPAESFVSLGGDSLSYVECSIRLESLLGRLPSDWHLRAVGELAALPAPPRGLPRLDTTVLFRAVGICLVVATHMRIWFWPGGAHLLLAVVGFNMSRFMLPIESTSDRVMAGARTIGRVVVPTALWVASGMVLFGAYSLDALLLVNNYVGPRSHRGDHWHFWFIEVFAHLIALTSLLLAIPAARRLERRWPYLFALALLGAALLLRLEWAQLGDFYNMRYRTHGVAWFFVLGWLVNRSSSRAQKLLTTAICLVTAPGFFDYAPREFFIAGALVVLVWWREIPFPPGLARPVGLIATASMWIYITHFTFWPALVDVTDDTVAYVLTILGGVAVWFAVERATAALNILSDR